MKLLPVAIWTGGYASGVIGAGFQRDSKDKLIRFDTNLDGTFADTVRTAAGADAFSPGFCSGVATAPVPSSGCTKDQKGVDFGGRLGYDWQRGAARSCLARASAARPTTC